MLKLIHTTDIHGSFFPYDFIHGRETTGSLCRVHSYVKMLSAKYGRNIILLDSGDIIQGQPTCSYSPDLTIHDADVAADVYNYMHYDAVTIGNHDVETGHGVYDAWRTRMRCPVLAANIIDCATRKPYFQPYTIIEREGVRIGVLGMTTQAVGCWIDESLWQGMRFEDVAQSARRWIRHIKEKEDPHIIVGLFHTGWDGGIHNDDACENATKEVAHNVDGFDIILFGHDHKCHAETVTNREGRRVLCLNPSSDGNCVSEVDIHITGDPSQPENIRIEGRIENVAYKQHDFSFMQRFANDQKHAEAFADKEIGTLDNSMHTRDCFFGPAPFSDFIHRLQLRTTGADISFTAPLVYDEHMPKGTVRIRDLFNLYRYENQVCSLRMTGREIKNYLEYSYDLWIRQMASPQSRMMRTQQYIHMGKASTFFTNLTFNFDSAAGISYTIDVTRRRGERICISRLADGRRFLYDAIYSVAMHSYRAHGGTEFLTVGAGIPHGELSSRLIFSSPHGQRFYMMQLISEGNILQTTPLAHWRFIPEEWTATALERERKIIFRE